MKQKQKVSALDFIKAELGDGYIPISPEHNALKSLLQDAGKGDLSPDETERT